MTRAIADHDPDEIEFLRGQLAGGGAGDDPQFAAWLATWQPHAGTFAQHLVALGVLKPAAVAMLPMIRRGYAYLPFDQLLAPSPAGSTSGLQISSIIAAAEPDAEPADLGAAGHTAHAVGRDVTRRLRRVVAPVGPACGVPDLRGLEIDGYRLVARAAGSARLVIYDAVDRAHAPVSIMLVAPQAPGEEALLSARLPRDLEAAAAIADRRVLRVRGWGRLERAYYVVSDPMPSFTLRTLVAVLGPVSPRVIRRMIGEVAGALEACAANERAGWPAVAPDDILVHDAELEITLRRPAIERLGAAEGVSFAAQQRALAAAWSFGLTGGTQALRGELDPLAQLGAAERRCLAALADGDVDALPSWAAVRDSLHRAG